MTTSSSKTSSPAASRCCVAHVAQRCRDEARVIELAHRLRRVRHGRRSIEQDQQLRIGFAAIALEEALLGAREDVPIDVAEVVALGVGAVLGEFLGEAEIGRAVEPGDEAIDDGLGDEVEAVDGGEGGGV